MTRLISFAQQQSKGTVILSKTDRAAHPLKARRPVEISGFQLLPN